MAGSGGPEVLTVGEVPDPQPKPGELVIDVAAAGVNRADLMQRMGYYPPPPGAPEGLGLEVSGVVSFVADADAAASTDRSAADGGRNPFRVGDRVCALLTGGGYAERVAVPWQQVFDVPAGIELVPAAGLPETSCTVWSNLVMLAGLHTGDTVLLHGGTSGIGTTAIQIAVALGARVFVTAGMPEKVDFCRALGAEVAINYREQDFVAEVKAATEGRGVDVILDVIGAKYLQRNISSLARGGRLVVIGLQGGLRGELDLGALLAVGGSVTATSLRARPLAEKAKIVAAVRERVWPMIAAGAVHPIIDRVLPLERAAEAHRVLERSDHIGKVLLTLD